MSYSGTVKANSNQLKTMQRINKPAATHSRIATPELPVRERTLTGWANIPVPIVRFMIKQTTVNLPSCCIDVGETSNRYHSLFLAMSHWKGFVDGSTYLFLIVISFNPILEFIACKGMLFLFLLKLDFTIGLLDGPHCDLSTKRVDMRAKSGCAAALHIYVDIRDTISRKRMRRSAEVLQSGPESCIDHFSRSFFRFVSIKAHSSQDQIRKGLVPHASKYQSSCRGLLIDTYDQ